MCRPHQHHADAPVDGFVTALHIRGLLPLITNGPFTSWTIPVLGIRGTAIFLGTSEWTFGTLLFLGFWNKKLGVLGALGSTATFISTLTILPFVPDAWEAGAGGFPAMAMNAAFLLKDLVLLVVSIYLLRQDVARSIAVRDSGEERGTFAGWPSRT
ncbi:DUF417 family protein [Methylobacterium oxalidis]|uniref:DUF417 family protein n=1 Tax=Methylobacterium oxalidis TaxID=944322 RepID=UPI003314D8C2